MGSGRIELVALFVSLLVAPTTLHAQRTVELSGVGGKARGTSAGRDGTDDFTANVFAAELLTNARSAFHLTLGMAYWRVDRQVTPGQINHYAAFLPGGGVAYDFIRSRGFRARMSASGGVMVLRTGEGSGVIPLWEGLLLQGALGGSLHFNFRNGWGAVAGVRAHAARGFFLGATGMMAPFVGISWTTS